VLRQYALFAVEQVVPPAPVPEPVPAPVDDFDVTSSRAPLERAFEVVPATAPRATLPDAFDMARIAAGTLASAYGGRIEVAAFRIDRTPVTNAAYAEFLRATGEPAPAHWLASQPPPGTLDHPVTGVTHDQARRYAEFRGKRLPTSAEWEHAARPLGRAFPWGTEWDPARCRSSGGTAPVGAYPEGASADGVLDLVGNVWEWTDADPRLGLPADGFAWVLGGSYRHPCHVNGAIARSAVSAHKGYEYLGFRCALDEEA
jgi:formylglycine-generating enzyme required for sulfatase activity